MGVFNDSGTRRFTADGNTTVFEIEVPEQPSEDVDVHVSVERHDKGPPLVVAKTEFHPDGPCLFAGVVYREVKNTHQGRQPVDMPAPKGADFTLTWHLHGRY